MNNVSLDYNSQAKALIEEGDVLLFRAPSFPKIGFWICKYTGGIHSHVGLAHWDNNDLYIVEQKEFKGGRSVLLSSQVKGHTIDVYRPKPKVMKHEMVDFDISWHTTILTDEIRSNITRTALSLTGTNYGWKSIWEIFKGYAPFFRIITRTKNGDNAVADAYVCSTVVTYSYRMNYEDPCPNLSDKRTSPADIAQSTLFEYLFTLKYEYPT